MSKEVTLCKNCRNPLTKRLDSRKFEVLGRNLVRNIFINPSNEQKVICGKCGNETTFSFHEIKKGLSYAIASPK